MDYINTLSEISGLEITYLDGLLEALRSRVAYFHENGCRMSDHGLEFTYSANYTLTEVNTIFKNRLQGKIPTPEQEMIFKKFKFKSFKQSLNFTNIIGELAELEGHHPDISLGWGYVLVMLHTHAIKGLSLNDFVLASKIDNLDNSKN